MIQVSMQNQSLKFTNVYSTSLQKKNILVWFTKKKLKKEICPWLELDIFLFENVFWYDVVQSGKVE